MRTITITTALFALLGPGMLLADDVMQAAPKAQAASSLQITLRIGSPTALPGITDGIWLDVRNNGSSPATFSDRAALQVVTAEGEPFIPYGDNSDEGHGGGEWIPAEMPLLTSLDSSARSRVLAPGEMKTFLVHEGLGRPFMCDDRMNRPGVYRLRLVVDEGLSTFKLRDKTRVLDQEGLVSPLVSNEVVLTVREPDGDDAKAWALREQLDRGSCRWNLNVLVAEKIWASYPTSAYAFFATRQLPFDYPTRIAQMERAVALKPGHPAAEIKRIDIADSYGVLSDDAMKARNVQLAIDYVEKRRELLLGIVRRGINPRAEMLAVQALDTTGTREDYLGEAAEWDRPPRVKAYLDCIEPFPGGGFKAWLNYDNSTGQEREFPMGERNKFTPGPFDRGQPQTFVRGLGWYFSVTSSDGSDLMWHIDGQNLKISAKKLMDPPDPDYGWEYWTEEKALEKKKATFRCAPGFAPDPFKLHETAMQSVPQVPE